MILTSVSHSYEISISLSRKWWDQDLMLTRNNSVLVASTRVNLLFGGSSDFLFGTFSVKMFILYYFFLTELSAPPTVCRSSHRRGFIQTVLNMSAKACSTTRSTSQCNVINRWKELRATGYKTEIITLRYNVVTVSVRAEGVDKVGLTWMQQWRQWQPASILLQDGGLSPWQPLCTLLMQNT